MSGPVVELRTRRLLLRPVEPGDFDALHAVMSDWAVVRQLGGWPWPPDPAFTRGRAVPYAGVGHVWGVVENGAFLGTIGITGTEDGAAGNLGYALAPHAHGRGIMGEATEAALAHVMAHEDWDRIEADTWADNPASHRVLTRAGFTQTGTSTEMSKARGVMTPSRSYELTRMAWAARNPLVLRTGRLTLRPLTQGDAPALIARCGVPAISRNLHSVPSPWPEDHCAAWIDRALWRGDANYRLAVDLDGDLIGTAGITGDRSAPPWLVYFIAPEQCGHGYATEAARAIIADAFDRFGLTEIQTLVLTDNHASIRVLEKLGFTRNGGAIVSAKLAPRMDYHYRLSKAQFEDTP